MIHYHGGPITPDTCAVKAWKGRHAFISYANSGQLGLAAEIYEYVADNTSQALSQPVPDDYFASPVLGQTPINTELLEALKDARYQLYGNGPGNPKIDAAIAKAAGESENDN